MKKSHLLAYGVIAVLFGVTGAWMGQKTKPAPEPLTMTPPPAAPATGTATPGAAPADSNGRTGAVEALFSQWMPDDKGTQQSLAQWQGKPLLVNFWAPWCAPCVQEMPELSQLQSGGKYKDLQVVGIGIDTPANIAEFNKKFKIAYPLLVGGSTGTELSRILGNAQGGLPFTVLIGADGAVKKAYLGRLNFEKLEKDLAAL
ncbi:TlpA family protein disulfide reductase [Pseudoduganella chitinolytica]|uniref:TlpA disulfide reductase family protein n=1 Tax=Pseudoduganella chitinolytica TaxID=34070 RepID=A0ABY8BA30_9BURK|nr:TlpA disulfide reductase family protein [Pseudoduganella chitinolytica]WEF31209.1 TlpA disulfide reductase family protein [Pseudoduganella chitinolytica]